MDLPIALDFWEPGRFLSPLGAAFGATIILSAEAAVILAVGLARLVRGHVPGFAKSLTVACLTSICAYSINDYVLKAFFGVPTPADVMHGARHSLNFWMGSARSSFPSGHMVLAGAFAGTLMRLYRASIWPLSAMLLLAAGLLVVGDWHFLSDVIAGAFLSVSAGLLAGQGWAVYSRPERSSL